MNIAARGTTSAGGMVVKLLYLALLLFHQHGMCWGEDGKQVDADISSASSPSRPPPRLPQDSVERAKAILGITTAFQEGGGVSEPLGDAPNTKEILSSLRSKFAKLSVPKPLDIDVNPSQSYKKSPLADKISKLSEMGDDHPKPELSDEAVLSQDGIRHTATTPKASRGVLLQDGVIHVAPLHEPSKEGVLPQDGVKRAAPAHERKAFIEDRRQGRDQLIRKVNEELLQSWKEDGGATLPSENDMSKVKETEKAEPQPMSSQEAEGSIEQERVPSMYDKVLRRSEVYRNEEPSVDGPGQLGTDKNIPDVQLIKNSIKGLTNTFMSKASDLADTNMNRGSELEDTHTSKASGLVDTHVSPASDAPKTKAAKDVDELERSKEVSVAAEDETGKMHGLAKEHSGVDGVAKSKKVTDMAGHETDKELDLGSEQSDTDSMMQEHLADKESGTVVINMADKIAKSVMEKEETIDKEKKEEHKSTKEDKEKISREEDKEYSKDVQPLDRSLEVEGKVLSAIKEKAESLVNVTISPSPVLSKRHKLLTHSKPDATISHFISAKDFFNRFPIRNFTHVDEADVSFPDATSADGGGISLVEVEPSVEIVPEITDKDVLPLPTAEEEDGQELHDDAENETNPGEVSGTQEEKEGKDVDKAEADSFKVDAATQTEGETEGDSASSVEAIEAEANDDKKESSEEAKVDKEASAEIVTVPVTESQPKDTEEHKESEVKGNDEDKRADQKVEEDTTSKAKEERGKKTDVEENSKTPSEEEEKELGEKLDKEQLEKDSTEKETEGPEDQTAKVPVAEVEDGKVEKPSETQEEIEKDERVAGEVEKETKKKKEGKKKDMKEEGEKKDKDKKIEKEESEKAADTLETYSQFTQRVNAEKKNDIITNGGNGHSKGPKVKSKNYASPDCGSKLLTANPEASHTSKVIHANRDEYMLNKCRDKIWFIIELCESIRPQKFEIANFELFSNLPRDMVVSGSHRYPTRDWTPLARVTGQEGNRGIQPFPIETEDFFKYIKVEVLSHYGSEFFCPISLFRIYGLSEFEVIDTIEDSNDDHDDAEEIPDTLEEHDKKKAKDEGKPSVIPTVLKNMLTGVLDVIKRGYRPSTSTTDTIDTCFSLQPSHTVPPATCHLAQSLNYILSCYHLEYLALMQTPVVSHTVKNSAFCRLLASSMCLDPQVNDSMVYDTVCNNSYVCVMLSAKHVLAMCFMHDNRIMNGEVACDSPGAHLPENFSATSTDIISPDQAVPPYVKNAKINTSSITRADALDKTSTQHPDQHTLALKDKENRSAAAEQEAEDSEDKAASGLPETSPTLTPKFPKKSRKTTGQQDRQLRDVVGQDNATTQPEVDLEAEGPSLAGLDLETEEVEDEQQEDLATPSPTTTTPPPQAEAKVSSTTPTNKESVVVRLSNKIKALEYNMSISSQYLEELSRRYKRQMEEMQRQFNLTIAALNATSHQAYERDQTHQRDIEALERMLANATEALEDLMASRDTLANTVVEQHLLLMAVEVVVLCLVFTLCHRRTPHHPLPPHNRAQTPNEDGHERSLGKSGCEGERGRVRRRSVDSITRSRTTRRQRRPSEEALRISGTYQDLLIIEPAIPIMVDRKRKKKSSSSGTLKRSKSNASIVEKSVSSSRRARRIEKLDQSSAGVLFCGDQVKDTEPNPNPSDPVSSPDSPDSSEFPYQPFVNEEDPGYYSVCGEFGSQWVRPFVSEVNLNVGMGKESIVDSGGVPKRHSFSGLHSCDNLARKGSRMAKSLSLNSTTDRCRSGDEKVKKHRKVKKTKNGVIEDRQQCGLGEGQFSFPVYHQDYYYDPSSARYSEARHYIDYYYSDHSGLQYSDTTNGHINVTDIHSKTVPSSYVNGDTSQAMNALGSDYIPTRNALVNDYVPISFSNPVVERRKPIPVTTTTKVKLRSDNWEWYSAQQGGGRASSSETVSSCSDSSGNHRKLRAEDRQVEKVDERAAEKADEKKVRKKKKSKVRSSVVVVEEEPVGT